jgi:phosphoglycolate phosphatase-like HAD superfamily hydrolase
MVAEMKYDAIIFDFDGVLVESVDVKGEAFRKLYEEEGKVVQDKVLAYHEVNGGLNRYEKIQHIEEVFLNRSIDETGVQCKAKRYSGLVEEQVVRAKWVKGAKAFLDGHYKTLPLYVVSATPQEELRRIVDKRGMTHYFRAVYGAPEKKYDHIFRILKEKDYDPGRMLMIGDAMADYEAAEITGLDFIGRALPARIPPFPKGTALIADLTALEPHL